MGANFPSAIILVNADLTDNVRNMLIKQLAIDEILDGYTFDSITSINPNFITETKNSNKRILVERSYQEFTNKSNIDIAIFVKLGLASILENKIGPHGITYKITNLTWDKLNIYEENKSIF